MDVSPWPSTTKNISIGWNQGTNHDFSAVLAAFLRFGPFSGSFLQDGCFITTWHPQLLDAIQPTMASGIPPKYLTKVSSKYLTKSWGDNKNHEKKLENLFFFPTPFCFPNPQVTPSPAAWVPSGLCDAFPMTWRNCSQDQRGWDQADAFCWVFPSDLQWCSLNVTQLDFSGANC